MYVDRATLRMGDEEIQQFLHDHQWGRLASVSPDGEPHVAPIGYVTLDGRIYFHGLVRSRRGRDLAAGSRVSLCVDDGVSPGQSYSERRGVIAYGRCRTLEGGDEALRVRVRDRFAQVFFGDAAARYERSTHAWYELLSDRYASWDFGRIPAGADRFGG